MGLPPGGIGGNSAAIAVDIADSLGTGIFVPSDPGLIGSTVNSPASGNPGCSGTTEANVFMACSLDGVVTVS